MSNYITRDIAEFHILGNSNNLYKYNEWKTEMLDYHLKNYDLDEKDFYILWNKNLIQYEHDLYITYLNTIFDIIMNNNKYQIGDICYIEDEYETRQYYGLYFISYDIKNNKKTIIYANEDSIYSVIPIFLKNEISNKPLYFIKFNEMYDKLFNFNKNNLSNDPSINNAYCELTSNSKSLENSLYWLNKYIEENSKEDNIDSKIVEIRDLLMQASKNIDKAFMDLDFIFN